MGPQLEELVEDTPKVRNLGRYVYQKPGCPVSIGYAHSYTMTVEEVAKRTVPRGLPFWVVPDGTKLHMDRALRNAYDLDESVLGEPTGYGEHDKT